VNSTGSTRNETAKAALIITSRMKSCNK
jgi:hypothetical protein